jgi:multicomponent Na+:H+ antiporter subunit D
MAIILYNLPAFVVILPLIISAVVAVVPSPRIAWLITLVTVLASSASALANLAANATTRSSYELGGWPPPWGIEFISDGASTVVAVLISGLSILSTIYAKPLIEDEIDSEDIPRVYGAWLLAIGGLQGIVMTGDTFNLFVFLEISALSAVILVALGAGRDRRALPAAYNYLTIGAVGATFYVIGVGFCYAVTGTLNMADLAIRLPTATPEPVFVGLAFMMAGIMVKAAVFPVHIWLPATYGYAPTAAAVLLAAVSTKAALYVLARLLFTVYADLPEITGLILTWILIPVSLMAMFAGSILAIYERDLRLMLAQSSIAQIGYITLALGVGTVGSISAGFIHIINHAMIKGGMFMAVGALAVAIGKRANIRTIEGLGQAMPITGAALLVCSLSLIGVPLTTGFISKLYLAFALIDEGYFLITGLMLLASVLSVIYIWKIVEAMWLRPAPKEMKVRENPWIYAPLWLLASANILFGIYAAPVIEYADLAARALLGEGG